MALVFSGASACSEGKSCPAIPARTLSPADSAYVNGDYAQAEQLYAQALARQPQDPALAAALVRTLLREGKTSEAAGKAAGSVALDPHSAIVLTAQAEVELRQGEPWLAQQSLDTALAADPCNARTHLIRSRMLRIDSMYASERAEIQKAYEIDPGDPDIVTAWSGVVSPALEIEGIEQSLKTMKDIDADTKRKAEASMRSMLPLLYENSQTCKVPPSTPSATLPLLPSKQDGRNIDGFRLEVELPKSSARLMLDTAASGLFISKTLADENGLQKSPTDPAGTVHLDTLRLGPLEFHDCIVGVTATPFAGKAEGSIGADIFSPYLITIDSRLEKLVLDPLPAVSSVLPGDRSSAPELAGFTPVYHRRQYLLVPVTLDNKSRKLFALDTGMRLSAMSSDAAHSVSNVKVNFTNALQTASGPPAQVYRDNFDFAFANLSLTRQSRILEYDTSAINRSAGFEIAGLLGFDILHQLTLHLDYRDGLVKFDTNNPDLAAPGNGNNAASTEASAAQCPASDTEDRPSNTTIEATVSGGMSSAHLKPGKEIWVKLDKGYEFPGCTLDRNAIVYGHVTAVSSNRDPDSSELALVFDHGDCTSGGKRPLTLRLLGLVGPPDESKHSHEALPTAVAGGGRSIEATISGTTAYDDDLNPGGPPKTVHPGIVVRLPDIKLDPDGGPSCSARITSKHRSVELGPGVELVLGMYSAK